MKTESLLQVLGLGLRVAETMAGRVRPIKRTVAAAESRVDKVVARVVPAAQKALDHLTPAAVKPARKRRRRASVLTLATASTLAAATAGVTTYIITRNQQQVRERYRPVRPAFPVALLDVLSAPGGGGRLDYDGSHLVDRSTSAIYTLIDGIPDFIAPASSATDQVSDDANLLVDLLRPQAMRLLGRNSVGNAAFASATAAGAGAGWALSVPSGRGTYELEMARANPRARILCVGNDWDTLLEVRRKAIAAGLNNMYYAHGLPRLLPVQDGSVAGVWTAGGLDRVARPERELTQMVRAARRGALVAGVSLVRCGSPGYDLLLQLGARRLPGARPLIAHLALLEAAGLRDVRAFRDGAFVRFTGVRV